jgi:alpha-L-fucosidase 2
VNDGEMAYRQLSLLLAKRTLPNLFDLCGPFQIDGNFGATSGIAEMLLQSHRRTPDGTRIIELLPALPAAWPTGSVTGLRARDGFEVDVDWHDGRLTTATIRSTLGGPVVVRHGEHAERRDTRPGEVVRSEMRGARSE